MFKKIMLFFFCMIFLVATVSAVAQVNVNTNTGLQIFHPDFNYVKQDQGFNLSIHVSNISNGVPFPANQVNCSLDLYNSLGTHTLDQGLFTPSASYDLELVIDGGNFSDMGIHAFYIACNQTVQNLGGEASGVFEVTYNGEEPTVPKMMMFVIMVLAVLILMLVTIFGTFKVENYGGKFALYWASHLLMVALSFMLWNGSLNFLTGHPFIIGFFRILWWISMISIFPMLILSVVWIFYTHVVTKEMERLINGGMSPEEAFTRTQRRKGGMFGK